MESSKTPFNRWYLVMLFCLILSFVAFMIGPCLNYAPGMIHDCAIMIGLWAPTAAIFGVRAELLARLK
jgi:hypothetical protein